MKRIKKIGINLIFFLAWSWGSAQIGIGTVSPKGMLDLQNNKSMGLVFPKAALTSTSTAAPVVNPNGGNLVAGTAIFNTNTINDVSPGIYVWEGTRWIPQYMREDYKIYEQTPLQQRIALGSLEYNGPSSNWVYINNFAPGNNSFTPIYSGTYKIKVNQQLGAGKIKLPVDSNKIMMATQEGLFRFNFNGTNYLTYSHSYSMYNAATNNGTFYEQFPHDTQLTLYLNLTAGVSYPFTLEFDMVVGEEFDDPQAGPGMGYVGVDKPCTVEFTFLE
ncbi:hypothetical protein [Aequorivita vladivostokensis]|uniref:Uncharacterized protein n=1 Tax=Aequorivita vladivostokensis TaxID=171194 RepID=A0ABR5DGE8_9FLAO|nr:hypothetical protein [Aequorivita vladivostokensis]KJJ37799.1 hypothetical protein MB09_12225 [Aequorivita vladivostokensis]